MGSLLGFDGGATISKDEVYRYLLWRSWNAQGATLVVVMLNPSTADARKDDPTIRKLMWFAGAWHYGGFEVVNLCAYRAAKPVDLWAAQAKNTDIVGPQNVSTIAQTVLGRDVLCAWGTGAGRLPHDHVERVLSILRRQAKATYCLAKTVDGYPVHPLYQLKSAPRLPFNP